MPARSTSTSAPTAAAAPVSPKDRLEDVAFGAAMGLFASLPRRSALRLGATVGSLLYVTASRARAVALTNLEIAFPERSLEERRAVLRASCRNLGRVAAEFCHLPRLSPHTLPRYVDFADRDRWERTIRDGTERGALVLTGHFGNWELLAYAHGLLGHPITLVHRPMRNPLVDARIAAVRAAAGTKALHKRAAARDAIRTLRGRGIVAIPLDQNQSAGLGVFVDFFGRPACTTFGLARLARLTKVPVYPVFLVRRGESERHLIEVLPPVEGADEGDVTQTTQRCTRVLEDIIRRHPEQWIWFHKRWKTPPPGEAPLY